MPRRAPLLLTLAIVLVLLAGGAWWLQGDPEAPLWTSSAAPPVAAAASPADGSDAATHGADLTRTTAASPSAATPDGSVPRARLASLHGVPLRVVHAEDETPIPAAEVWWFSAATEEALEEQVRAFALRGELAPQLRALGRTPVRADESGRLVLPASPREFQHASARSGDLSGMVKLWPSLHHGEELLRLQRTASVTVRVLTSGGEPAVGARVGWEVQDRSSGVVPVAATWRLTDARGEAVLRDVPSSRLEQVPPQGTSWWITVLEPFEPRIRVACDAEHPPATPVVLQLPPHGEVIVTATDARGDPATDGTVAYLHAAAWNWRYPPHASRLPLQDGRVRFPFVGVGLDLEAGADVEQAHRFATTRQVGPRSKGEVVTIPIRPSAAGVQLTGRIVADADLLVGRTWESDLRIHQPDGEMRGDFGGPVRLRADGSFTYSLREEWLRHAGRAEFALLPDDPSRGVQRMSLTELDWPPPQGVTDLGELILSHELLVAGRVMDAWGHPVPGLPLRIAGVQPSSRATPLVYPILATRLLTDEQGRFQVFGRWPERADRILYLLDDQFVPGPHFTRGASDLLLTLPALTTLHGRLLLAEGARPDGLLVEARITAPGATASREELSMPRADGSFHFRALPAGRLELALRGAEPPFRLPDVAAFELRGAPEERPDALNPLDLRELLRTTTIEVRSKNGEALSHANFLFQNPAGPMVGRRYALPITLTIPIAQDLPATCSADGYASAPVDWSLPHQVIVLDPLPRVRLRISGLPERSAEYGAVELSLERRNDAGRVTWSETWTWQDAASREVWVPEPGAYFARLVLIGQGAGARTKRVRLNWGGDDEFPFEVPGGASGTDLVLAVHPDALAAALTALRAE